MTLNFQLRGTPKAGAAKFRVSYEVVRLVPCKNEPRPHRPRQVNESMGKRLPANMGLTGRAIWPHREMGEADSGEMLLSVFEYRIEARCGVVPEGIGKTRTELYLSLDVRAQENVTRKGKKFVEDTGSSTG